MQVHWTVTIVYRARVAKLCQESAVDAYLRHSMQAFTCAFLGTCVWPFTFHSPSLFRSPLSTLTSLSHTLAYTHVTHLIQYQWMNNSISLCILINFIFLLLFYIVFFVYFFYFFSLCISLTAAHSLSSLLACTSFPLHGAWIVRVSEPNSYEEAK